MDTFGPPAIHDQWCHLEWAMCNRTPSVSQLVMFGSTNWIGPRFNEHLWSPPSSRSVVPIEIEAA